MGSVIIGSGTAIPERVITNDDLTRVMDTDTEWIERRTGVRERHFAAPGTGASDLGAAAGAAALAEAGVDTNDVDLLITATMTPDFFAPGIAPLIQAKMGLGPIPAHDLRAQCSGFLYALDQADAFLSAGKADTVLVVGAEVHAGYQPWVSSWPYLLGDSDTAPSPAEYERNTEYRAWSVLFGDGAGAVVLRRDSRPEAGLIGSVLHTDGDHFDLIHVPGIGFTRQPYINEAQLAAELHMPTMKGRELFRQAVTQMPEAVRTVTAKAGYAVEDLDVVIVHQANARIVEAVRKGLELPAEKVPINIDRYGNTTAATVPILWHELVAAGRITPGTLVAITTYGAGAHWGAALYRAP
jgi:3-oxoacyl-[acyl-carrier-protein] synthase-3